MLIMCAEETPRTERKREEERERKREEERERKREGEREM